MRNILTLICLMIFLGATAQDRSIEFEEYDLDNGLHVILHQDNSTKKVRNQPGWFELHASELNDLIEARNSALSSKIARHTRSSVYRLRTCRKNLKSAINRAKNEWIYNNCRNLNDANASRHGTKVCWDKLKTLQKGLIKPKPPLEKMM
ncbi:MAG: hypothetical protein AAF391_09640, partial [Bacteroidota bacterium]